MSVSGICEEYSRVFLVGRVEVQERVHRDPGNGVVVGERMFGFWNVKYGD